MRIEGTECDNSGRGSADDAVGWRSDTWPISVRDMITYPARSGLTALVMASLVPLGSCGPKVDVESVETAQAIERDEDAEVLVFVRDVDGIPQCPWEVMGSIEVDDGWREDEGDLRDVKRAAARLGGHAVLAETATAGPVRVLRFFDPLCNPGSEGYKP